jgi:NitT/TauT family transport system permease protein
MTGVALLLLFWSLLAYSGKIAEYFLPSPTAIASRVVELFQQPIFWVHMGTSGRRILLGFIFSVIVGLPGGLALVLSKPFASVVEPLINGVRYTPVSAFIPLLILWFGVGDLQKITVVLLGTAPYLAILVADTVASARREYVDTALTLGATRRQVLVRVILPYSLPGIWDGLRVSLGIAWTYLLTAELVGASFGLGHFIMRSQRFLQTANMISGILLIGFIGLMSDYAFKYTYRHLFGWWSIATQRERANRYRSSTLE